MGLKAGGTKWVLLLASSKQPEPRHILDLAFGLYCLESAGVAPADIAIYIDGADRAPILQWIGMGSTNAYVIKLSSDLFTDLAQNAYENIVIFVTGHGGIQGIDAPVVITPSALLMGIKSAPNLVNAVLYLGQCYAGVFNYIGAGRTQLGTGPAEPSVIIIGATNLHGSLSGSTQEQVGAVVLPWVANLFLLHVFKWISNPVDVDGDGKHTVIDSYKYAGAMANDTSKNLKINSFVRSFDLHSKWLAAGQAHSTGPNVQTQLALQAAGTQLEAELQVHYTHQESWILNAIPAQRLEF